MKRLLLACALIPCIAFANGGFNSEGTRVVVKNGSYSIEYDPRHDMRGASYRLNGNQFRGSGTLPAVVVGSNGARSADVIPAAYRVVTDKRKVFASILQRAREVGPYVIKGGARFIWALQNFLFIVLRFNMLLMLSSALNSHGTTKEATSSAPPTTIPTL